MEQKKEFDQFFTNPKISDKLVKKVFEIFSFAKKSNFLEPSAGSGNFVESLEKLGVSKNKIKSYDIEKRRDFIEQCDYLLKKIMYKKERIVIGNPPFGKRGVLALKFLNKALSEADIVAFIMPKIFERYSIQKRVNKNAKLIYQEELEDDSFLVNSHVFKVKTVFQIWVTNKIKTFANDLRIKTPPKIRIDDLETWIHNNTKQTLKYFNKKLYKWDFAIHRQGYYDYNKLITKEEELIKNRQYFFIKLKDKADKKIIKKINFQLLANRNTQVLGFSTYDFIEAFLFLKKNWKRLMEENKW